MYCRRCKLRSNHTSTNVHVTVYCDCVSHVTDRMMYFFQVVNGLMEREDWEAAIKVPIGMLPTGSGNALVASTLHESE